MACITANTDGEVTSYQVQIGFSDGAGKFNSPDGKQDMTCQSYGFADFNGDGRTDIFCYGTSNNHVYISNGDGTFTAGPSLALGCGPVSTIFGYSSDFNGDGRADIACRNGSTGAFQIYLAAPSGTTFTAGATTTLPTGCNIFYGDFNGDGKTDLLCANAGAYTVYFSNGDGTFTATAPWAPSGGWCSGSAITAGDFDGDGKVDLLCEETSGRYTVALAMGNGQFEGFPGWTGGGSSTSWCDSPTHVSLGDFNGDGRTDLICNDASGNHTVAYSDGHGSFIAESAWSTTFCDPTHLVSGDFNGDNKTDLVCNTSARTSQLATKDGDVDLVSSFTSGLGAATNLLYQPFAVGGPFYFSNGSLVFPALASPGGLYGVRSLATSDGIGGAYTLTYMFSGAQTDLTGRGFQGFASVVTTDTQRNLVTTTGYNQNWPFTGTIATQNIVHGGTTISSDTYYYGTFVPPSMPSTFVYNSQLIRSRWELDGTALTGSTITNRYDDAYCGNPTEVKTVTTDAHTSQTDNSYVNDTANWIIGRLSTSQTANTNPDTTSLTRTTFYNYDSVGALTEQVIEPTPSTNPLRVQTIYGLDSYGNAQTATVSGNNFSSRTTTINYDAQGRFPTTIINALSQSTSVQYDGRFGGMTSQTDPNSVTMSWSYDPLGRKTLETRPDGTTTGWNYYQLSGTPLDQAVAIETLTTGAPLVQDILDTLLRKTYHNFQGFDGTTSGSQTTYNANGQIASQTRQAYAGTGWTPTYFTYDDLNRRYTETRPDSAVVTYGYGTSSAQAVVNTTLGGTGITSRTSRSISNGVNEIVQTIDAYGSSTTYAYDPFGNLNKTTDPQTNIVTMTYDLRGHKTGETDPDRGSWIWAPDALGEITSQTDGNGHVTTLNYDLLGRLYQRTEPDLNSSWTYDTQPQGIGKLATASTSGGYSRTESYDAIGRPSQSAITIDGTAYSLNSAYDGSGRLATVTYPAGTDIGGAARFEVAYNHNSYGYLSSLSNANSGATVWTRNTMDANLNTTQETAGNGVGTASGFDVMGRIASIQTGGAVQNFTYAWDPAGNLSSRADHLQSDTESFGYDLLNRVGSAGLSGGAGTGAGFAYDTIGNLTQKTDIAGTGTGIFSYPAAGAAQPHAVQSISGTVNDGAGATGPVPNPTYLYDHNGNMVQGGGRTVTYTTANLPATIANGTSTVSFAYDGDRGRYKEIAPASPPLWAYIQYPGTGLGFPVRAKTNETRLSIQLAGTVMARAVITATGAVSWTSYVFGDGQIKGTYGVAAGATTYRYYHHDHLGSVTALTDAGGAIIEQTSFDSWGKLRHQNGATDPNDTVTSQSTYTYTEQENLSEVALLHMNARLYDPQIGRFLGADPLVGNRYSSQGWNRFAYVENNPLNSTDPSGMQEITIGNHLPTEGISIPGYASDNRNASGASTGPDLTGGGGRTPSTYFGSTSTATGTAFIFIPGTPRSYFSDTTSLFSQSYVSYGSSYRDPLAYMMPGYRQSVCIGGCHGYTVNPYATVATPQNSPGLFGMAAAIPFLIPGAEPFAAAEGLTTAEGTADAMSGARLAQQLTFDQASSLSSATGELSPGAIANSRNIISSGDLGDLSIPQGFDKFTTPTLPRPGGGSFQTRFYMNPTTGEVYYGSGFKTYIFP